MKQAIKYEPQHKVGSCVRCMIQDTLMVGWDSKDYDYTGVVQP